MKNQNTTIRETNCGACEVRIPRLALGQWTYCWQCKHRGPYDSYEGAYRCGKDGVIEPSGGCSGAGDELDQRDWDEPEEDD